MYANSGRLVCVSTASLCPTKKSVCLNGLKVEKSQFISHIVKIAYVLNIST